MIELLWGLALLLCVGGSIAWWLLGRQARGQTDYERHEFSRMPREIRGATLESSEQQLAVTLLGETIPVRPDQVYRLADGQRVPVDTKTRNAQRIYPYDLIELSLQAAALAEAVRTGRGARPATTGYIRIKPRVSSGGAVRYLRASLLPKERLEALFRRYQGILAGTITPTHQTNPRACQGCGFRRECPKAAK